MSKISSYFGNSGSITPTKKTGVKESCSSEDETDQLLVNSGKKKDRKLSSSSSPQLPRSLSTGAKSEEYAKLKEATSSSKKISKMLSPHHAVTKKDLLETEVEHLKQISALNERINLQQKYISSLEMHREKHDERIGDLEALLRNRQQSNAIITDGLSPSTGCFGDWSF